MEFGKVMWHPLGTTEGLCLLKNNELEGSTPVWKQGLRGTFTISFQNVGSRVKASGLGLRYLGQLLLDFSSKDN